MNYESLSEKFPRLTNLNLAKAMMKIAAERYLGSDNILRITSEMTGVDRDNPEAMIIVLNQIRDSIHEASPAYIFGGSPARVKEVYDAIILALEELESVLEESLAQREADEEIPLPKGIKPPQ